MCCRQDEGNFPHPWELVFAQSAILLSWASSLFCLLNQSRRSALGLWGPFLALGRLVFGSWRPAFRVWSLALGGGGVRRLVAIGSLESGVRHSAFGGDGKKNAVQIPPLCQYILIRLFSSCCLS